MTETSPFSTPLQQVIYLDRYSRWREEDKRRETWEETVERVIGFLREECDPENALGDEKWNQLYAAMYSQSVMPSMRIVQMAGPALKRCHVGAYNCSYLPIDSFQSFAELLYILMQGTGVGFSVESKYVEQLPVIAAATGRTSHIIVEDTTEGWCDALALTMWHLSKGTDVTWDFSRIRPQGAPLKTKGGRASGPEPLKQLLTFVKKRMNEKRGHKLTTLDAHDIACFCGSIVQVGGVRRAAEISLSDFGDVAMRDAKSGAFWSDNAQRSMANNSAVYEDVTAVQFMEEWLALAKSGTGERGIFNRKAARWAMPARRDKEHEFGTNPCGEIVLRPRQFCNLSIAVARPDDTAETLKTKVELAAIFGTLQSRLTKFNYIGEAWAKNCRQERLLGVDITGQMDCPLLRYGKTASERMKREDLLARLRAVAVDTNRVIAEKLGIPQSAAVTCVKPSGNSAQLLGCSSGLHPRYAPYYVRRVRMGAYTPLAALLRDSGVPCFPEVGQTMESASVLVFEFPVASPEGAVTKDQMSAKDQLNNWYDWKMYYTEHNPSCTIYVKPEEWVGVGAWVYEFMPLIGGLSFLPVDGGVYELAPYEEISKAEYERRLVEFPIINFDGLPLYERQDMTEINRDFACLGDRCEL